MTVWDIRVKREDEAHQIFDLKNEWVEYYLTDVHQTLKDKLVKVYLRWEQMTTVGPYYSGRKYIGEFTMPKRYKGTGKRKYTPGPSNRIENY